MLSMTNVFTGPRLEVNFRPACSCIAVKMDGGRFGSRNRQARWGSTTVRAPMRDSRTTRPWRWATSERIDSGWF